MNSGEFITAYRPVIVSRFASGAQNIVYLDRRACEIWIEDNKTGWVDHVLEEVQVRVFDERHGAVGNDLVTIIHVTAQQKLKRRALAKLTDEERRALGY